MTWWSWTLWIIYLDGPLSVLESAVYGSCFANSSVSLFVCVHAHLKCAHTCLCMCLRAYAFIYILIHKSIHPYIHNTHTYTHSYIPAFMYNLDQRWWLVSLFCAVYCKLKHEINKRFKIFVVKQFLQRFFSVLCSTLGWRALLTHC